MSTEIRVHVAGESPLLMDLLVSYLQGRNSEGGRADFTFLGPPLDTRLKRQLEGASAERLVVLLAEPRDRSWRDVAWRARRSNPRIGVLVLTYRPSYYLQRYWRRALPDDAPGYTASGILTLDERGLNDLDNAILTAAITSPAVHSRDNPIPIPETGGRA